MASPNVFDIEPAAETEKSRRSVKRLKPLAHRNTLAHILSQFQAGVKGSIIDKKASKKGAGPDDGEPTDRADAFFDAVDKDSSGFVSRDEFRKMHSVLVSDAMGQHSKLARAKKGVIALAVGILILLSFLGTSVALNFVVVDSVVRTGTSNSELIDKGTGAVVGTRPAQIYVPLTVAPAMTVERLATVSFVRVTFLTPPPDLWPPATSLVTSLVERGYHVHSFTKLSDAEMWFRSFEGHLVHVKEGKAKIVALDASGRTAWSRDVCSTSVSCAALRVDSAEELAELTTRAEAALPKGQRLKGTACESGVCEAFGPAYEACPEADKATWGVDMAPACVASVVAAMGQTGAYSAAGVSLTCAAIAGANMKMDLTAHSLKIEHICEWDAWALSCPASCAQHGRRAAQESSNDECEDAHPTYIAEVGLKMGLEEAAYSSCLELADKGLCNLLAIKDLCPKACGVCGTDAWDDDEPYARGPGRAMKEMC